jgi:hypothetical protein
LIPIMTIFSGKKILGLLGIDLKFDVVWGIVLGPLSYIDDFLYERQNLMNFFTKHAKQAVSFCLKNNETCEIACFASKQNFAKHQVCFAKHKTCFVLCFSKYKTKLVSLETLLCIFDFDIEILLPKLEFRCRNRTQNRNAAVS